MSLGTPLFTANGFTSGSVNRPWHRSRPTAAARPWIIHGGKFKKNDFRLGGGFTETLLLEKVRGRADIFVRAILQSTSVLKAVCASCLPASCPRQIILGFILLLFLYLHWCVRASGSDSRLETEPPELFLILSEYLWLNSSVRSPTHWYITFNKMYLHLLCRFRHRN